jgi:hypothetical protein
MDPLKITPPFSYSYQCGSTLLVSYIPVYMYSVSLQLISITIVFSIMTISSFPEAWLVKWVPPVGWSLPMIGKLDNLSSTEGYRLINPHQIISNLVSNLILLLSFGLCSPVLACYITLSTCVTAWCWVMMVGRFVACRLEIGHSLTTTNSHTPTNDVDSERNPISALCHHEIGRNENEEESFRLSIQQSGDRFLCLLNLQLCDISSVIVCKWPIIVTSCFFVTLLCWDFVGDEVGWREAFWVPVAGIMMLLIVWIWDHFLTSHVINLAQNHSNLILSSFFSISSSSHDHLPFPTAPAPSPGPAVPSSHFIELVR